MKLQSQKDFFIRPGTLSDQNEVMSLVQSQGAGKDIEILSGEFGKILQDPQVLFKVVVNSNGVVIGLLWCTNVFWKVWAVNPNFRKQELQLGLLNEAKVWAETQGGALLAEPNLIFGDLKSFMKRQGVTLERVTEGTHKGLESIRF